VGILIIFCNVMQLLADHGWTSYRLRRERVLSEGTLSRIRNGQPITTVTVDTICRLCSCQPGDLLHYVPDPGPDE
jgi:putative transcriptional regulator